MTTPTFTAEPPTKPGWYLWRESKQDDGSWPSLVRVHWFDDDKDSVEVYDESSGMTAFPADLGGLWCRLVPEEDVERAFVEAQSIDYKNCAVPNYAGLTRFEKSRARKVMEGEV